MSLFKSQTSSPLDL